MSTVEQVIACVRAVFENKGQQPPAIGPDTPMDRSLGLESLDYAELVVRLEDTFGFDPFASDVQLEVRTVADLAGLYER